MVGDTDLVQNVKESIISKASSYKSKGQGWMRCMGAGYNYLLNCSYQGYSSPA